MLDKLKKGNRAIIELEERPNRKRLLNMFFMCGGRITIFKQTKLITNLLSIEQDKPYIDYFWTDEFFGPFTRGFSKDLEFLINNDFLIRKYKEGGDDEPVHHFHILTAEGKKTAKFILRKEAKVNPDYINITIGKCLAYNVLPPGGNLCLLFNKFRKKYTTYLDDSVSVMYLSDVIKRDVVESLIENFPGDIETERKHDEKEGVITYDIKIPPSLARKRYHYLRFTEEEIKHCKELFEDFCSKSNKMKFLKDIIGTETLDVLDVFPKAIENVENEWKKNIDELESIKDPNKYWEKIIKSLEELYRQTEKNPFKLKIYENDNRIALYPSKPMQKYIKKEGFGCYDKLWATIQPYIGLGKSLNKDVFFYIKESPLPKVVRDWRKDKNHV